MPNGLIVATKPSRNAEGMLMGRNRLHWPQRTMHRFAAHSSLRPSLAGFVAFVLDAAVWYAALLFDDPVLVFGALAGIAALAVALLVVLLQAVAVAAKGKYGSGRHDTHIRHQSLQRLCAWLRHQLWPRGITVARQYEQRDQDGGLVARFTGELPQSRGLYRCAREAWRWNDPFGLFVMRMVLRGGAEHAMLADAETSARAGSAAPGPHPLDRAQEENTALVRDYVAGDPPKLIAWRQSAHRGALMTRETEREAKPTTIIVLDARAPGTAQDQVESEVMQALALMQGVPARQRDFVVTDGIHSAATTLGRIRLLASMRAIADMPAGLDDDQGGRNAQRGQRSRSSRDRRTAAGAEHAGGTGAATDGAGGRIGVDDSRAFDASSAAEPDIEAMTAAIRQLTRDRRAPASVIMLAASNESPLAAALRETLAPGSLQVRTAGVQVPAAWTASGTMAGSLTEPSGSTAQDAAASEAGGGAARTFDDTAAGAHNPRPLRHFAFSLLSAAKGGALENRARDIGNASGNEAEITRNAKIGRLYRADIVTALALLAFFELAVQGCTALATPDGTWVWFARIAFALVAAGRAVPERSDVRELMHAAFASLAMAFAAAGLVLIRLHGITGAWLFDAAAHTRSLSYSSSAPDTSDASVWRQAWQLLESYFQQGFEALIEQLPPVRVSPASDLVLIVVVAIAVLIVRWLLVYRALAPVFALLPLGALAAGSILLGHNGSRWIMAALAVVFVAALWSRALWRRTQCTSILWSGGSAALAPREADNARGFDEPEDSGSAPRPEKAERARRVEPIALPTVCALLVAALATALTGSAMNLAYAVPLSIGNSTGLFSANTINPMVDLRRALDSGSYETVLSYSSAHPRYLRMSTLDNFNGDIWQYDQDLARNGDFYGAPLLSAGQGQDGQSLRDTRLRGYGDPLALYLSMQYLDYGNTSAYDGNSWSIYGNSGAESSSPFIAQADIHIESLSSRFLPVVGAPLGFNGVGSAWTTDGHGVVYNPTRPTNRSMRYSATGVYLDPIGSESGFDQISSVEELRTSLIADQPSAVAMPWSQRSSSRRLAARQHDGSIDGNWLLMPLTIRSGGDVVDAAGNVVGATNGDSGTTIDAQGQSTRLANIVFNDAVNRRLGFNVHDEPYGLAYDSAEHVTLAMLVDFSAAPAQGWDDGDASDVGDDELAAWQRDPGRTLLDLFDRHSLGKVGMTTFAAEPDNRTTIPQSALRQLAASQQRIHEEFTELPAQLPARVRAIVNAAETAGIPTDGDDADSQIAAMRYLVDYFTDARNDFVYSLDAPDGGGRDNMQVIDDFLRTRSGYCVHYASALAVLGRAMGVPTRMVLGYRGGSAASKVSGSYAVSANQLHSWVEAYIDGVGWVPFDVTPAADDQSGAAAASSASPSASATTPTPSPSTPSSIAEPSASTPSPSESGTAAANADPGQRSTFGIFASLPQWVRVALWMMLAILLAAAIVCVPPLLRAGRHRRRLRAIGSAAQLTHDQNRAARAWILAWEELQDTAWDVGVRWGRSRTDQGIAADISHWVEHEQGNGSPAKSDVGSSASSNGAGTGAADVRRIADAALAAAFSPAGGRPVGDLQERLETLTARMLSMQRAHSRIRWLLTTLLPGSLFTRPKAGA